jgi:protein-arginine kinase activator protein McsA
MRCNRCGKETNIVTGSYFDTTLICKDCDKKERAHPKFEEARRVEMEQVLKGNYNYEGIGKPSDL